MDGGHENKDINLHKVIFWLVMKDFLLTLKSIFLFKVVLCFYIPNNFRPSNIVKLFERFVVPYNFDLLSVDTDAYDWFMLEAIFEAGYKPRVVITEINAW